MVAGAAGSAIGAAARGSETPPAPPGGRAIFHGFGREPGWVLDVFEDRTVFAAYGVTSATVDTPPVTTTFDGHRYEAAGLTIAITHGECGFTSGSTRWEASVAVTTGGREYRGCGTELAAH